MSVFINYISHNLMHACIKYLTIIVPRSCLILILSLFAYRSFSILLFVVVEAYGLGWGAAHVAQAGPGSIFLLLSLNS